MAGHKATGKSNNGRDSVGRRLGVKLFGDQSAKVGSIIIRQRGTHYLPGKNVGLGRDHTIFSLVEGRVLFSKTAKNRTVVNVVSSVA